MDSITKYAIEQIEQTIKAGENLTLIWRTIKATQDPVLGVPARLLKVQEEAGEVAAAFISNQGLNVRKLGKQPASNVTIVNELLDVAITALVAVQDWSNIDPLQLLAFKIKGVADRCQTEGS